ncbi:allatostatin-A receptor-like [Amphiura filiformis]|uniref:allatostatin-A receptor-like n=1 Tax=Amphiura filiformis TaxID=82378 RepID=UPI003B21D9FC
MALATTDFKHLSTSAKNTPTTTTDFSENEVVSTVSIFDKILVDDKDSFSTITSSTDFGDSDIKIAWNNVEFEVPFLLAVAILGVLGNALVLAVYLQKRNRKSNAALYIINLAIGDLFILLVVVVMHITEFFPQTWPYLWRYHAQCWLHRFARFLGFNSTIFTSVAIAYDRFLAVVRPLEFRSKYMYATKRTVRIIIIVWIAAFLAAIPCAWNFRAKYVDDYYENYHGKLPFACWLVDLGKVFNDFKMVYISILLFCVPLAITFIFYTLIIGFIWRNNTQMKAKTTVEKIRRTHWQTARTLLIVFIAYVACYILFATYTIASARATIAQQLFLKPMVKNVGLLMPYVNSCLNPIVYSVMHGPFRSAVKQMFCQTVVQDKNSKGNDPNKVQVQETLGAKLSK